MKQTELTIILYTRMYKMLGSNLCRAKLMLSGAFCGFYLAPVNVLGKWFV